MQFSDFINIMNKYLNKKNESHPVFLESFCSLFVDLDQAECNGYTKAIQEALSKLNQSVTASKIFNGKCLISKNIANVLFSNFDSSQFLAKFDDLTTEESIDHLVNELNEHGITCNADTVRSVIAELYQGFLGDAIRGKKKQKKGMDKPSSTPMQNDDNEPNLFDEENIAKYELENAVKKQLCSLLGECDRICPNDNCHNSLVYEKNGRAEPNYEVIKIDPNEKPTFDNLIALCPDCAKKYKLSYDERLTPTQTRMQRMKELKSGLAMEVESANLLKVIDENDIRSVMLAINDTLNKEDPIPLNYDPVEISQKIEPQNGLLLREIKRLVREYYDLVRKSLRNLSDENALTFDLDDFAHAIKTGCKRLVDQKLSQPKVFNLLVSWLKNLSNSDDDTACRIIVAYFVQNCEVFHAITK